MLHYINIHGHKWFQNGKLCVKYTRRRVVCDDDSESGVCNDSPESFMVPSIGNYPISKFSNVPLVRR